MSFISYLQTSRVTVVGGRSPVDRRRRALERVSKELSRGNYETAVSLVKQLKGKHGDLSAFGSVKLLPKKLQALDNLHTSRKLDVSNLLSLINSVSRSIESVYTKENSVKIFKEDEAKTSPEEDLFSVVQHESGHFLVGYLLGVLPRRYDVSSVTGRVEFTGFEFLKEVGAVNRLLKDDVDSRMNLSCSHGNISSKTLNNFSCVVLGGLVTEHMLFGYSEGFYSDVIKLNNVLQWLEFTETEKEAHIKWAVSNTVLLLQLYSEARVPLAEAMAKAEPIGACFEAIESAISKHQI